MRGEMGRKGRKIGGKVRGSVEGVRKATDERQEINKETKRKENCWRKREKK